MSRTSSLSVAFGALWPWPSLYNRSQPLALALARSGCQVHYLSPHERRRIIPTRFGRWLQRMRLTPPARVDVRPGVHPNLHLVDVVSLRARTQDWWMRDYTIPGAEALRRYFASVAKAGYRLHLFASRPLRVSLLQAHPWANVTMDVVDPWPLMPWGNLPLAQVGIAQMFARADLIVSNGMLAGDMYRETSPRPIHDLPNGVEAALVDALEKPASPSAALSRGQGRFRLVFTGGIDMRIHFNLFEVVIPEFPEVDFYFVGKDLVPKEATAVWRRMLAMKNCFHVRSVPYAEMPAVLGSAHGLMLPYSEWGSNRMFPGKLLEYVAAARPIFASSMAPELESAKGAFNLYQDADGLRSALRAAISRSFELPEEVVRRCRQLARDSTWDRRAETLCRLWEDAEQTGNGRRN